MCIHRAKWFSYVLRQFEILLVKKSSLFSMPAELVEPGAERNIDF